LRSGWIVSGFRVATFIYSDIPATTGAWRSYKRVFEHVVWQCVEARLMDEIQFSVDSSFIQAEAKYLDPDSSCQRQSAPLCNAEVATCWKAYLHCSLKQWLLKCKQIISELWLFLFTTHHQKLLELFSDDAFSATYFSMSFL